MKKSGKDYIAFPLDVDSRDKAQYFVEILNGHIGMFKIGLELFIAEGPSIVRMVKEKSDARIFLDLKLHDISATVQRAMSRVANLGVDLVTVHCSTVRMLEKAVAGGQGKAGVLGVTLLTDNDAEMVEAAGFKNKYVENTRKLVLLRAQMAKKAGCTGIVCSGKEVDKVKSQFGPEFMAVTPGIRPEWTLLEDDDQKRVTTPAQAVASGADYIVIGRPIRDAQDPVEAADKVADEIETAIKKD